MYSPPPPLFCCIGLHCLLDGVFWAFLPDVLGCCSGRTKTGGTPTVSILALTYLNFLAVVKLQVILHSVTIQTQTQN